MKRFFSFFLLLLIIASCNKEKELNLSINYPDSAKSEFASGEVSNELHKLGYSVKRDTVNADLTFVINGKLQNQAYEIKVKGDKILVSGGDETGLMYGGLRIAEMLKLGKSIDSVKNEIEEPFIKKRGIKLNIPLDARTPSYDDTGDAAQKNIATMWEMDFWKEYLDNLARNRYNLLTLWSLHPYPSWVKVPEYPDVALDDVCVFNGEVTAETDMKWKGIDLDNPENLTVVKKMTIDEKIKFWQQVFQYAEDRGIDIYIFHWNVFVHGTAGKYGIEWSQNNPVTVDYIKKSVKQFLLTYPTIKGIGVTAGEHVNRNLTGEYGIENWMWKTYGKGVMDAKAENPDIDVRFIFRRHWSDLDAIKEAFASYDGPFETSFKYSRARMYSSVKPPWFDKIYRSTVEAYNMPCWLNVRNDDIFAFRWGDPDYARQYIKNMPTDVSPGFYMGPDGYVWGREVMCKRPSTPRQLALEKHWYRFMIWGRIAYNPDLEQQIFIQHIANRFHEADAELLYNTWKSTSAIISWVDKIHFRQNDAQFCPESCMDKTNFHSVNTFINIAAMPEQGVTSIADFAKNTNLQDMSPLDVAFQLDTEATSLLEGANRLGKANSAELEATITDLLAMGYLGKYYANKVLGATHLALYRVNGDVNDKLKAVQTLEYALEMWKKYAKTAQQNYMPTLLARTQMLDWDAVTPFVEKDIQIAKDSKPGDKVEISDDNKLWERDQRRF